MKRCPRCGREFDFTMSFCLDDGSELLYGPGPSGPTLAPQEQSTIVLPGTGLVSENPTATFGPADLSLASVSNSIAVLPFVDMSPDKDNEYFCDGLSEELLNALAKIEKLRVAARTSAFSFKDKDTTVDEIGRVLNVKTILEGSVRKASNRVRITTQLIHASDGYQLWSERFDREMKDIFEVQDEITLAVVEALKVKLLGEDQAAVLKHHTHDPEALEFYLRGVSYFSKFTPEYFLMAVENFRRAIDIDPGYAAAYAGLAECYSELSFFASAHEWMPLAKDAARKSIELDNDLGRAHNALAVVLMYYDRDMANSEEEFRRAISLDPGNAHIHMWYGWFLGLTRRFDEAFTRMSKARELDPLSHLIGFGIGAVQLWSDKVDASIHQLHRVGELNPTFPLTWLYLAEAYLEKENPKEALATIERAPVVFEDPISLASVAYVYARAGRQDRAIEISNKMESSGQAEGVAVHMAQVYLALGEVERAFSSIQKAVDENSVWLIWLGVQPAFRPLRSDPRFVGLLESCGVEGGQTRDL